MSKKNFDEIYGAVSQIKIVKAQLANKDNTLLELMTVMKNHKVESLLVMENNEIIGLVSATDIVRCAHSSNKDFKSITANEIMTKNPLTTKDTAILFECMGKMAVNKYRHLPLIDETGVVKGILTIRDLLYFLADRMEYDDTKLGELIVSNGQMKLLESIPDIEAFNEDDSIFSTPITQMITAPVAKIDENDTILNLSKLLLTQKSPCALVTEWETKLVGIVTLKDIMTKCMLTSTVYNPHSVKIKSIMTKNPKALYYHQWVGHALTEMTKGNFRNLPVINEDKEIVSSIGLLDILSFLYFSILNKKSKT